MIIIVVVVIIIIIIICDQNDVQKQINDFLGFALWFTAQESGSIKH